MSYTLLQFLGYFGGAGLVAAVLAVEAVGTTMNVLTSPWKARKSAPPDETSGIEPVNGRAKVKQKCGKARRTGRAPSRRKYPGRKPEAGNAGKSFATIKEVRAHCTRF